jgi:anti-repressor protein
MNLPQVFNFDNQQVRVSEGEDGLWFVASDVCAVLDISKHRDALARLDTDERGSVIVDTPGGEQLTGAVNESGLYSLIMSSRKPEAKKFKKWVTSEVLPQIRKTGSYVPESPALQIAHAMLLAGKMIEDQKIQIAEMQPKADFFDAVTGSSTAVDMAIVAKTLDMGIGRNSLFEFLRDNAILDRKNMPYQVYQDRGYFRVVESSYQKPDGSTHVSFKTVVYQKGLDFIRRKLTEAREASV